MIGVDGMPQVNVIVGLGCKRHPQIRSLLSFCVMPASLTFDQTAEWQLQVNGNHVGFYCYNHAATFGCLTDSVIQHTAQEDQGREREKKTKAAQREPLLDRMSPAEEDLDRMESQ